VEAHTRPERPRPAGPGWRREECAAAAAIAVATTARLEAALELAAKVSLQPAPRQGLGVAVAQPVAARVRSHVGGTRKLGPGPKGEDHQAGGAVVAHAEGDYGRDARLLVVQARHGA